MFEEESLCGAINENMKLKAASSERLEGVDLSGVHYRPCLQQKYARCLYMKQLPLCLFSGVIFGPRGYFDPKWCIFGPQMVFFSTPKTSVCTRRCGRMPDQPVVPGRGPGRPGWPRRIARGGRARLGWAGQGELGGLVSWAEPA